MARLSEKNGETLDRGPLKRPLPTASHLISFSRRLFAAKKILSAIDEPRPPSGKAFSQTAAMILPANTKFFWN
jgi:hypothetical protein